MLVSVILNQFFFNFSFDEKLNIVHVVLVEAKEIWVPSYFMSTSTYVIEPAHDKTYKMACASSEESDQPGHSPSLIRAFVVRSVGS